MPDLAALITEVLEYVLNPGSVRPPILFFFFKISFFLAILGSIKFHMNFRALNFSLLSMMFTVALYSLPFKK